MKPDKPQHHDDFIYALHDDIPQDFADDLYERLQTLDDDATTTQSSPAPRTWWTLAVASIMAVMLGGLLLVASQPDDEQLSTPNLPLDYDNNQVIHAENAALLRPFDALHHKHVYTMALSPDGTHLALTGPDGVYLHDAHNLHAEPRYIEMDSALRHMQFTDNQHLFGLQWDETTRTNSIVRLNIQTRTPETVLALPQTGEYFNDMEIQPAGTEAIVAGCMQDQGAAASPGGNIICESGNLTIYIYDLVSGSLMHSIKVEERTVTDIAIGGDWEWLIYSPSTTNGAVAYHLQRDETVTLPLPENGVRSRHTAGSTAYRLFTSQDGELFGIRGLYGRDMVQVWRLDTLLEHAGDEPPDNYYRYPRELTGSIRFHPETEHLLHAGYTMNIAMPDPDSPRARVEDLEPFIGVVNDAAFSPDGDRFYVITRAGLVQTWDWQSRQPVETLHDYLGSHHDTEFASSEDGQRIVRYTPSQGFNSGSPVELYEVSDSDPSQMTRRLLQYDPDTYYAVSHAAISSDGRFVATIEVRRQTYKLEYHLVVYDLQTDTARRITEIDDNFSSTALPRSMGFDENNHLRIVTLTGKIAHYTPEMLLDDSENPARSLQPVYMATGTDWFPHPQNVSSLSHPVNNPYVVSYICKEDRAEECEDNRLVVWDTRSEPETRNLLLENRAILEIDLPEADENFSHPGIYNAPIISRDDNVIDYTHYSLYSRPLISADGQLIAIERCLTNRAARQVYTYSNKCDASEVMLWHTDEVRAGNMQPTATIPLTLENVSLLLSPVPDENGNYLLVVSGLIRDDENTIIRAETHLYQIAPEVTSAQHIQTIDGEYEAAFRADGRVLFLRNYETRQYRAWGVPGLAAR